MNYKGITSLLSASLLSCLSFGINADSFFFTESNTIVGAVSYTYTRQEQTLPDIARLHDLGYHEIRLANPQVNTWIPGRRRQINLPKQFVLPFVPHEGIVINIPEMRLYYFPEDEDGIVRRVITHPIGIGREGWNTPYVTTNIIQKNTRPSWYPPESIREKYASEGTILPAVVKPGPDNPLGEYAMRLGLPSYLIHGTNRPYGVGMRVSSGCIRLYPEDIESLFNQVSIDTNVRIINQPYKVGIKGNEIYLEANQFLEEDAELFDGNLTSVVKMLVSLSEEINDYRVDWDLANTVIQERKGEPVMIGYILEETGSIVVSNDTGKKTSRKTSGINILNHVLDLKLDTNINLIQ
jgi:L,D-transpeptidase ErfK/SrfK